MTDQEINIAIAESCGWTHVTITQVGLMDVIGWPPGRIYTGTTKPLDFAQPVPDYYHDLNAMHEAECLLFKGNKWEACSYEEHLDKITTNWMWFAIARQRAEAFLRVKGLWK
jgi:hypothetical protein